MDSVATGIVIKSLPEDKFLDWSKLKTLEDVLTHSLVHHFETIPNSKKLQTTTEMWLLKDFQIQIAKKTLWKKNEIAHFEQFHLLPQCFPTAVFFNMLTHSHTMTPFDAPEKQAF